MQEFVEYLVGGMVDNPDDLAVTAVEQDGSTTYELRMNPDDIGRIIGRSGTTIQAVRHLLQVGSSRKGIRCSIQIVEEGDRRETEAEPEPAVASETED
jgi:predicted RNA-binding protein YlqC (UPF0109 family)